VITTNQVVFGRITADLDGEFMGFPPSERGINKPWKMQHVVVGVRMEATDDPTTAPGRIWSGHLSRRLAPERSDLGRYRCGRGNPCSLGALNGARVDFCRRRSGSRFGQATAAECPNVRRGTQTRKG
jgi:hypothetical protein